MNSRFNSGENLTELVFENKNKAYGAYALRASQGESVTYSVMTTAILFMALALLSFWVANRTNAEMIDSGSNVPPGLVIRDMFVKPDDKVIEKPAVVKKIEAPKSVSGQVDVTNQKVDQKLDPNDQQNISNHPNPKGTENDSIADNSGDPKGTGKEIEEPKKTIEEAHKIVDIMPYMDNMDKFIRDNLKWPRQAVEDGINGVVVLTFIVEKDGSITNIEILNGIGEGCEQEAARVTGIMPKWHPGILKGEITRTQCNLPIRFRLK
ncbi:MAG: energy transducer TonB [Bacteroidia bacterium]